MVHILPKKKYQHIIEKLIKRPVFTFRDMLAYDIPYNYAKRLAHMLVKGGRIKIIEKGKYATVDDPFLIAPFTVFPSYISMHSALYLNGVLQQVPFTIEIVTTRRKKHKEIFFEESKIRYYKIRRKHFFGFRYTYYENFEIPVAYTEKALIDIFYFNMYPIGTINVEKIDSKRLESYLKRIKMKKLADKVLGWLNAERSRT